MESHLMCHEVGPSIFTTGASIYLLVGMNQAACLKQSLDKIAIVEVFGLVSYPGFLSHVVVGRSKSIFHNKRLHLFLSMH